MGEETERVGVWLDNRKEAMEHVRGRKRALNNCNLPGSTVGRRKESVIQSSSSCLPVL